MTSYKQNTGIKTIHDTEIFVGDMVKPAKFRDIPNLVIESEGLFYRVKMHGDEFYFNPLGTCQLVKIGFMEEDVYNSAINYINSKL